MPVFLLKTRDQCEIVFGASHHFANIDFMRRPREPHAPTLAARRFHVTLF